MKIIVLNVRGVGEYADSMDCNFAIINPGISREALTKINVLAKKVVEELGSCAGITDSDYMPTVLSYDTVMGIFSEEVAEEWTEFDEPVGVEITDEQWGAIDNATAERIECSIIHAAPDGFHWSFYPKHTEVECETSRLPIELVCE